MRLNSCAKILYRSTMSKFDIPIASAKNQTMNVSLPEQMEEFVRQKVAFGDYETASEVVREGLRLLKQRDDLWKAEVRSKIKQGMDSIRDASSQLQIAFPGYAREAQQTVGRCRDRAN